MLLLRVMVGMILLGGLSGADAAVEEVDYEATNYYNGEYDANDGVVSSTYTDDDIDDDSYVITDDYDDYETANVDAKSVVARRRFGSAKKRVYVPVYVPEIQKKKMKIIAVDKGFYIPGGTQLYGKFVTLKACMKACALAPGCFSADYNPWLRKCYQHSNYTACNTRKSHSQFVHFSKVPCTIIDAPAGQVTLGASVQNGLEQKGIETITECIKKCVNAGGGIPAVVPTGQPDSANVFFRQGCFAIDYDFATHKCFFFATNLWTEQIPTTATPEPIFYRQVFLHCPISSATRFPSLNTIPNPTVVHITFCPLPV